MEDKKNFQRHVAVKVSLSELAQGSYLQESEQEPPCLITTKGNRLYRVNVMGIVLKKEMRGTITSFLIDDGSGQVLVRSFEENESVRKLEVGSAAFIIGRMRQYNLEKYLSPEIVKIVEKSWLKVRSLELLKNQTIPGTEKKKEEADNLSEEKLEEEETQSQMLLPVEKIVRLIKELDLGEGVPIEEAIAKCPVTDAEKWIEKMLESGDIFQNLPGKIKVL